MVERARKLPMLCVNQSNAYPIDMQIVISRIVMALLLCVAFARGQELQSKIEFSQETLDNGLKVIYAPMKTAPVVHVRVLYFVGSRDERPDRQGFAHMFEHMMFRGSQHVAPEQHMKLIGAVGGNSNAFTSFDQTTYTNSLPSSNTEMALYMEADRMASFKVNDQMFQTERKVVAEEWRMRYANQPMGPAFQDLLKTAFTDHSYRWTPIGDMQQLAQATSSELQTFFNTYYVPNNACVIIAGDIDLEQTKQWVKKYYGWIPKGPEVPRLTKPEPRQTEVRRLVVTKPNIPLTNMYIAFKTPGYRDADHDALSVLADVLSSGRTGRLDQALVYGNKPMSVGVGAGNYQLFDPSLFVITTVVQQGNTPEAVEAEIVRVLNEIKANGITQEELDKVRTQLKQQIIRQRQDADDVASQLGEEAVFGGDANRVNQYFANLDALTIADIHRVAQKYLDTGAMTVLRYEKGDANATAAQEAAKLANEVAGAGVAKSDEVVAPRVTEFPKDYPTQPPVNREPMKITFNKGVEAEVNGVKVITVTDHRLPLVNASLIFRSGSHVEPVGKEGLADLTAAMMRRGSGDKSFMELSQELESRGIAIEVADAGDNTRLNIACTTDQLAFAIERANLILTKPAFPQEEFVKLRQQSVGGLTQSLSRPSTVVGRAFTASLFEGAPQGRLSTPESLVSITLDDVKAWYEKVYSLDGAFVVVSGDVTPEQGNELAKGLLAGFERREKVAAAEYVAKERPAKRQIILVDNPQGKQSTIRLGVRSYSLKSDEKFAGMVAGQILSSGIDSRLGKYVRAEKGLTYGVYAFFRPNRQLGEFSGSVDTNPQTTAAAIEAMFKVFGDMRKDLVTDEELAEAKLRVAGGMAMEIQTVAQQAGRRADQILNDYPIDYYDNLPIRVAEVTSEQVREVMNKYVADEQMLIVVVAPASEVKEQLSALGEVSVVPMPLAKPAKAE
jgi:zinc protease